jgi:hypothetical protein
MKIIEKTLSTLAVSMVATGISSQAAQANIKNNEDILTEDRPAHIRQNLSVLLKDIDLSLLESQVLANNKSIPFNNGNWFANAGTK